MGDFRVAFKKLKRSIVGIGIRSDPENRIFGTGFILDPSGLIVTNWHVLEAVVQVTGDKKLKLKPGAAAFLFIYPTPVPQFGVVVGISVVDLELAVTPPEPTDAQELIRKGEAVPPKLKGLDPYQVVSPETIDIGLCRINPGSLPSEARPLSAVTLANSSGVVEGTAVGVLGFPRGLSFPQQYKSVSDVQMTPLLQVGCVSGLLPMSGDPRPDTFVLDMMINPGSSGSPLFLENGNVVGLVCATRVAFNPLITFDESGMEAESEDTGIYVGSGLGLAIPSARFPELLFRINEGSTRKRAYTRRGRKR